AAATDATFHVRNVSEIVRKSVKAHHAPLFQFDEMIERKRLRRNVADDPLLSKGDVSERNDCCDDVPPFDERIDDARSYGEMHRIERQNVLPSIQMTECKLNARSVQRIKDDECDERPRDDARMPRRSKEGQQDDRYDER